MRKKTYTKIKHRQILYIQVVTAVVALVGALGSAFLTSKFALESARAQIDKDRLVLSASNANKNAMEIRQRAEEYLVSLYKLMSYFEQDRVVVDKVERHISELNEISQGLVVYGGPEIGAASMKLNLALKNALTPTSKNDLVNNMESVQNAAQEWYSVYFSIISSYERHTMPEKAKADFQNELMESLFRVAL